MQKGCSFFGFAAFVVTADAVLIEGIFYGGRDFEAEFRDRT